MPHRPRALAALAIAGALALGAVGCGSSSDSGSDTTTTATTTAPATTAPSTTGAAAGTRITVVADPNGQLAFEQKSLEATAGEVTFVLTNESPVPHNIAIERDGQDLGVSETITEGTAELTVNLEPGEYEFYCAVGDHEAAGMKGPLTVS
jgi:plastocyanin